MSLRDRLAAFFQRTRNRETAEHAIRNRDSEELERFERARAAGDKKTILFVCSGNSVRSQFAEALVNRYLGDHCEAFSAGILQIPVVPQAVKAMAEIGIDISGKTPKSVEIFQDCRFDRVIILCSDADQFCPVFLNAERRECIPFMDPLTSYGIAAVSLGLFRKLRDDMRAQLLPMLEKP